VCNADGSGTVCGARPGVPRAESCNGIDDDCDGQVDEDFTNLGQPCTVGVGACQNTGAIVCRSDGSGTVCSANPGVPSPEVCNGIDDDCDGVIDNGVGTTFYRDADGDSFGDPNATQQTCSSAPVGYVTNNLDCNDMNAFVNPAAFEVPGNSLDDD